MEKQTEKPSEEMPRHRQPLQALSLSGTGLLSQFAPRLQKMIVDEILNQKCERATDIWFCDEDTDRVWVMRYNMHWHLNETASALWQLLGDATVNDLLDQIIEKLEEADMEEARIHFAEFILQAQNHGIVTIPD